VCRDLIPPSQQENIITGLDLLRLLVQNRIAEFHTELELLSPQVCAKMDNPDGNVLIKCTASFMTFLMSRRLCRAMESRMQCNWSSG
jgi:26S proteasome regulatory subunit N12